jgi:hypothetical protein
MCRVDFATTLALRVASNDFSPKRRARDAGKTLSHGVFAITLYQGTAVASARGLAEQARNLLQNFRLDFWVLVDGDVRDSQIARQIDIHGLP